MTRALTFCGILVGPLFAFMVWRAGLAFARGQHLRGLAWAGAALVECVALAFVFDAVAVRL
jgi:hypothetical protein